METEAAGERSIEKRTCALQPWTTRAETDAGIALDPASANIETLDRQAEHGLAEDRRANVRLRRGVGDRHHAAVRSPSHVQLEAGPGCGRRTKAAR